MKNLTCKQCGGTMALDASGMKAVCHYCGNTYVLNHEDTDYYAHFFEQMRRFLQSDTDAQARKERAEAFWRYANEETFTCADGRQMEIRYMHRYRDRDAEVYVARRNIIFHFQPDKAALVDRVRRITSLLDYPSADTRRLSDFFPKITFGFALDGGSILVLAKDEDEYPLRLFGTLDPRHVAWIISRMENLCCVLEYSELVHPEITPDTLYINPYTHQASLYGSWWKAGEHNKLAYDRTHRLTTAENLLGLRQTGATLLGFRFAGEVRADDVIPPALAAFLNSPPQNDAYTDFERWDKALIDAFGERKFIRLDTEDKQIYHG